MKILLCGEGEHEIGEEAVSFDDESSGEESEGWMQPLVRRLVEPQVEFHITSRANLILLPRRQSKFRPMPAGHGAKALIAKLIADEEGMDAVVFMADADTKKKSEWRRKRAEIHAGFSRIESNVAAIACVPKSASESWLLSDPAAWQELGLSDPRLLPTRPEDIWGARRDRNGQHPHQKFAEACRAAEVKDDFATRSRIAAISDLSVLARKCPLSFQSFKAELEEQIGLQESDTGAAGEGK